MAPIFTGSLQPKKKSELQEIAVALNISDQGTKDDIVQRISKHLDTFQDSLEDDPAFTGLFSRRKRSLQPQPIPSSRLLPSEPVEKYRLSTGRKSHVLDPISESTPTKDVQEVSMLLKDPISPVETRESLAITSTRRQIVSGPPKSIIGHFSNVPVDNFVQHVRYHEFVQGGKNLLMSLRLFLSNSRNIWIVSVLMELFYILACIIPWKHSQVPLPIKEGIFIQIRYPPLLAFQTSAFWLVLLHWAIPSLIIPALFGCLISFNPALAPTNSQTWGSASVPLDPLTASIVRIAAQFGYPYPSIASNSGIIGLDVLGFDWRVLNASVGLAFALSETISAAPQTVVDNILTEERRVDLSRTRRLDDSLTSRRVITSSREQADEVD